MVDEKVTEKKEEKSTASTPSRGTNRGDPRSQNRRGGKRNQRGGNRGGFESQPFDMEAWKPKTELGRQVKSGEITDIDTILDSGSRIMEREIVDAFFKEIKSELLLVGQSKGKFGGGQRRVFKQTQKKTREGNKPKFGTFAVVGNGNGYVGVGYGKSKETVPAREKAFRNAKLNLIKIRRGCGSWQCGCGNPHTIPFKVEGKCSSVRIVLKPAPKGTGLCVEKECAKILAMAGFKDMWSKTYGQTTSKLNLIVACMKALEQLSKTKVQREYIEPLGIVEGSIVNKMDSIDIGEEEAPAEIVEESKVVAKEVPVEEAAEEKSAKEAKKPKKKAKAKKKG